MYDVEQNGSGLLAGLQHISHLRQCRVQLLLFVCRVHASLLDLLSRLGCLAQVNRSFHQLLLHLLPPLAVDVQCHILENN